MAESNPQPQRNRRSLNPLTTLSQMAIGGAVLVMDILRGRYMSDSQLDQLTGVEELPEIEEIKGEQVFYERLPESDGKQVMQASRQIRSDSSDDMTFILTGILVDTSNRVNRISRSINRASGRVGRIISPRVSPFIHNPLTRPFNRGFNRLVTRGENRVERWKRLGQNEAQQGYEMIETITLSTLDTSVDYIAEQPQVIQLASSKTQSFASIVLEYIRRIFVSVDVLMHGIFRRITGLPRTQPLPPTDEIRLGATSMFLGVDEDDIDIEATHIGYYTGFFSRISALVIDLFILGITLNIGLWFIKTAVLLLGLEFELPTIFGYDLSNLVTVGLISVVYFWVYHTLLWTLFGWTFGQALLGIRVLTRKGDIPGLGRSFLRASIGISLSLAFFILAFFMMFFDNRHRALHDWLFGTLVVYSWDAQPSQRFLDRTVEEYE